MAQLPASANRPLSPHLQIYRRTITMMMSIMHRVTGAALYFGTLVLAWWLIAVSIDEDYYSYVNGLLGTIPGRFIMLGYTWALIHHMFGGVKHLIMDTGRGFEKDRLDLGSWIVLVSSLLLTILVWLVAYWSLGAFG